MPEPGRPRLLVLGAGGQVGWELTRTLAPLGHVLALDRASLDLLDPARVRSAITANAPQVIVNAAAYTHVDGAESEPALAMRVNGDAPAVLAAEAAPARGVYHMAPPDHSTWHGFASAIVAAMPQREGSKRPRVTAITSAEYPTPAARPAWSVLDARLLRETFGLELPPWRVQLAHCMEGGGA